MKIKASSVVFSFLVTTLATVGTAEEKAISASEVPAPVQASWARSPELGPVKQITRRTVDGKTIYDVVFEKNNAANPRVRYSEAGTIQLIPSAADPLDTTTAPLLASGAMGPVAPLAPQPRIDALPEAVQATIRREAKGRTVADIDQEQWKSRTVYEVEFAEPSLNPQIHVAEDGQVLRGEKARTRWESLYLGTQLEDTPPAVQSAIKRTLGGKTITDIDREGSADAFSYEIEVEEPTGPRRVRFSEKGELLSDSYGPKK